MVGVGPVELLVFLPMGAVLVYLAARDRVRPMVLVLLMILLSPPVAAGLAFFVLTVLSAFAP